MKRCAYCGRSIRGEAIQVGDDAGSGTHAPAYWHKDRVECGPKQPPLPGPDDGVLVTVPARFIPPSRQGRP